MNNWRGDKMYSLKRMKQEITDLQKGRSTGESLEFVCEEEAIEILEQSKVVKG